MRNETSAACGRALQRGPMPRAVAAMWGWPRRRGALSPPKTTLQLPLAREVEEQGGGDRGRRRARVPDARRRGRTGSAAVAATAVSPVERSLPSSRHGRPPPRRGRRRAGPALGAGRAEGRGGVSGRPMLRRAPTPPLPPRPQAQFQARQAAPSPAATVSTRPAPATRPPHAGGGLAAPSASPPPLVGPALNLVGDVVERAPTAPRDVSRPAAGFPRAGHRRESKVRREEGGRGGTGRRPPPTPLPPTPPPSP